MCIAKTKYRFKRDIISGKASDHMCARVQKNKPFSYD